jgi:GH35 family endo-1,4-beta-xylanase
MSIDRYQHRKSKARLSLSSGGKPLMGQNVTIKQTNHEFLFGVGGFDAVEMMSEPLAEERRTFLRERLEKIFSVMNYTTLPFYLGRYEPEEGKPDDKRTLAAAGYYKQKGIKMKGHPLVWHTVCAPWLMEYSNKEILHKLRERIKRDITLFKGLIDTWDVINEVVIMPAFSKYDNAVTRVCREIGRVSMIREVFIAAREANPSAVLLLNDYDLSEKYEILIDGCLQAGLPIDVIGIQSHQHQGYWGAEKTEEILKRYAQFGIPMHFTENTIISGELMPSHISDLNDWKIDSWSSTPEGEERQTREVIEMYSNLFAHPLVEAITTWDAVDGKWLKAPSGLLREDNSVKPVFTALSEKIKGEWQTNAVLVSGENGVINFEGFRGEYEAECQNRKVMFTLTKDSTDIALEFHP